MKTNNILKISAGYLNKTELQEAFENQIDFTNNVQAQELLALLNLVLQKLATEYGLCKKSEKVWFNGENKLDLQNLKNSFFAVRELRNSLGFNVKVNEEAGCLIARNGEYMLTYIYLPKTVDFNEEFTYFPSFVLEQVVALGVVAEYFLKYGFYSEYEIYEYKFQERLNKTTRRFNEIKVKCRRWE